MNALRQLSAVAIAAVLSLLLGMFCFGGVDDAAVEAAELRADSAEARRDRADSIANFVRDSATAQIDSATARAEIAEDAADDHRATSERRARDASRLGQRLDSLLTANESPPELVAVFDSLELACNDAISECRAEADSLRRAVDEKDDAMTNAERIIDAQSSQIVAAAQLDVKRLAHIDALEDALPGFELPLIGRLIPTCGVGGGLAYTTSSRLELALFLGCIIGK